MPFTTQLDARFVLTTTSKGVVVTLVPGAPAVAPSSGGAAAGGNKGSKPAKGGKGGKSAKGGKGGKGGKPAKGAPAAATGAGGNFERRDRLVEIAKTQQALWDDLKLSEAEPAPGQEKFMCTFPYPYMNGRLHLGHAFSITKAEFAARYQRLLGKAVLFPFSFHCTGMPIQAAANKLKVELNPELAASAGVSDSAPAPAAAKEAVPGVFSSKKSKSVAKSGGAAQSAILKACGVPDEDVPKFQDPTHWLEYFPPIGKSDLKLMGAHVDWRRSFITTDANPFYDSFVRWQFNILRTRDVIAFGKRPTVFSAVDGQACADHDRASGEGVKPQEYTLIKMGVVRGEDGALPPALAGVEADGVAKEVFLVAATLRPETMYGQTNCFVLPEGQYGAFEMNPDASGKPVVFVCAERSAMNMSWQDMTPEEGNPKQLAAVSGADLLGMAVKAPNATFAHVYVLPLLTISMGKGTGVVTSVPSDAPDDYAALQDLKNKPALREKFGIQDHMVLPFDVVDIINIPGYGSHAAVTLYEKMGIKSQNDTDKLKAAKEEVYTKGFYEGVMLVGSAAGKTVQEAKPVVRAEMLESGDAAVYWEPESEVISRTGDECVVSFLDQWYLKYGEEEWQARVLEHVEGDAFNAYTSAAMSMYQHTLGWLHEWACSRSFGLGTKLPWDPTYVIESLSDSTIYMAYYTIAHKLQGGDMTGKTVGPAGIAPAALTDAVWSYIYLGAAYPADCGIPEATLAELKAEFEYWYPLDLRVSGKDLIQNHLTMSLYNHAAVWQGIPNRMPKSFFTNGHVMVDGEKMSKSKGNFIILQDAVSRWSADGVRFGLAGAGDTLEEGNFEGKSADTGVSRLFTEEKAMKELVGEFPKGTLRSVPEAEWHFLDHAFHGRIQQNMIAAKDAYDNMRFQAAQKFGFYELLNARDKYRDACKKIDLSMHQGILAAWMDALVIAAAPIVPHWADHMYTNVLHPGTAPSMFGSATWPVPQPFDAEAVSTAGWLEHRMSLWRATIANDAKRAKTSGQPKECTVYVGTAYAAWQLTVLGELVKLYDAEANSFPKTALKTVSAMVKGNPDFKHYTKTAMIFAKGQMDAAVKGEGAAALSSVIETDEIALLTTNMPYIKQSLGNPDIVVLDAATLPADNVNASRSRPGAPIFKVSEWA